MLRPFIILLALILAGCAGRNYSVVEVSSDLPERINLSEVPFFPQQPLHCGPAALATVMGYFGSSVTPESLVDQLWTPGVKGAYAIDMSATTRSYDLLPFPGPQGLTELLQLTAQGWPSIHLMNLGFRTLPQWHYAVLVGYDLEKQAVLMRSGKTKERWYSFYQFDRTRRLGGYWSIVPARVESIPVLPDWQKSYKAILEMQEIQPELGQHFLGTAVDTYPDQWQFKFAMANSYFDNNNFLAAVDLYSNALNNSRQVPEIWNNLAYGYQALSCPQQAVSAAICATRIDSKNQQWQSTLTDISETSDLNSAGICNPVLQCPVD